MDQTGDRASSRTPDENSHSPSGDRFGFCAGLREVSHLTVVAKHTNVVSELMQDVPGPGRRDADAPTVFRIARNPIPSLNEGMIVRYWRTRRARLSGAVIELPEQPNRASFFAVQE